MEPKECTIDHIRPIAFRGTDEPDNLRVLCRRCNGYKQDRPYTNTSFIEATAMANSGHIFLTDRGVVNRPTERNIYPHRYMSKGQSPLNRIQIMGNPHATRSYFMNAYRSKSGRNQKCPAEAGGSSRDATANEEQSSPYITEQNLLDLRPDSKALETSDRKNAGTAPDDDV